MTERLKKIHRKVLNRGYSEYHQNIEITMDDLQNKEYSAARRSSIRFRRLLEAEIPYVFPEDNIALIRTVIKIPSLFQQDEWNEIKKKQYICERGEVFNICSDYERIISLGFKNLREEIAECIKKNKRREKQ